MDACLPRSAANLLAIVHSFDVEHHYLRNADGTHCGEFVRDVLKKLDAPMPREQMYANEQIDWMAGPDGWQHGWKECVAHEAAAFANEGMPVVATYRNKQIPPDGHSHIAIVVPAVGGEGPNVAQAGASNFSNKPVVSGFGNFPVRYFFHV